MVALAALGLAAAGRGWLSWKASDLEEEARRAWSDVRVVARDPRAQPNESALALEDEARTLGLELAPRGSSRTKSGRPAAVLPVVHESLLAMALEGKLLGEMAPELSRWRRDKGPALAQLAAGVVRRPAPAWETPAGRTVTRAPPPGERADRMLVEAGRIEGPALAGEPLSDADAHLVRPGSPRLTSLVLLEELLLIDALERGRADDGPGATRSLRAFERILEGVLDEPDPARLGVGIHLARLQAAVLRQLPFDEWPRGVLDARLRDLAIEALDEEARRLASGAPPRRGAGAVLGWVLDPVLRSATASSRSAIATLRARAIESPCDIQSRMTWVEATEAAPWWDPAQSDYLGDLADLTRRAALADIDRELTRLVITTRAEGLADAGGSCPDWRFATGGPPDAPRLRYVGPAPAIERAMPFALSLEASP